MEIINMHCYKYLSNMYNRVPFWAESYFTGRAYKVTTYWAGMMSAWVVIKGKI